MDKNESYDVFIGRPSVYSNPFKLGRDGTRLQVIVKFEAYFRSLPNLNKLLDDLEGKRIACWCHLRQDCHGDSIICIYNERLRINYLKDLVD